jgi:alkanesulfonate monooxygenase SsuD/methylene tetrahydromethanopterin reductase-like flavin-dependent oxidoreductase (luciferase family)
MEIGICDFAEVYPDPRTGQMISPEQRLRDLLEEAELAEQVGLDVYAIGEHHRPDMVASAPPVILAAVAARTSRLRLSSAVTVLSSDDPVRVFQQFATLDLISGGRAEIMAGRGSFTESFPLFGYDLADYDGAAAAHLQRRHGARPALGIAGGRRTGGDIGVSLFRRVRRRRP